MAIGSFSKWRNGTRNYLCCLKLRTWLWQVAGMEVVHEMCDSFILDSSIWVVVVRRIMGFSISGISGWPSAIALIYVYMYIYIYDPFTVKDYC